jgi:hypothetical protein
MRWLLSGNNKNQQKENIDMKRQMSWLLVGLLLASFLAGSVPATAQGPVTLEVLNPRGEMVPVTPQPISARLDTLEGKKIGVLMNAKAGAEAFWPYLQEALTEAVPTIEFQRFDIPYNDYPGKDDDRKELAAWSDGVISMLGD